jgi:hypothetical protein
MSLNFHAASDDVPVVIITGRNVKIGSGMFSAIELWE